MDEMGGNQERPTGLARGGCWAALAVGPAYGAGFGGGDGLRRAKRVKTWTRRSEWEGGESGFRRSPAGVLLWLESGEIARK